MTSDTSAAHISTRKTSVEDIRRSITYHPTVWGDHFLAYTSDVTEITAAEKEQLEIQKGKVKKLLAQTPDESTLKLELIDAIQRLGVAYHFEQEIDDSLRQIHLIQSSKVDDDVGVVALRFRLLRQQGYRVPCDVFNKFIDEEGNFKESLINDVEGMLSLYEASNYGVNGEEVLDKALEFSSSHLESLILPQMKTTSLSRRIKEALEMPIHLTLIRFGATKFMSLYKEDESHNHELLQFAKLDFNIVQKMHQNELQHITRWWKDLDFANKLPFARDRVTESYFWSLGVYFEPHYKAARRILTQVIAITTILDDIYDVHGTLDELKRFTEAIESWDISVVEELPPYMRTCYEALLGVYADMEDEMAEQGKSYRVQYAIHEMKKLLKSYMDEAEWCYGKYIPTMDEYMKLGVVSSTHMMLATTSLVGMRDPITQLDFHWITHDPPILQASQVLGRLMDDIAGIGEEKVSAVSCYMNERGCSDMEALSEISKIMKKTWKEINDGWFEPRAASLPILERILNFTRVLHVIYSIGEDGFTNSTTKTKQFIKDVIVDPIQF
ncbi:hypothetical protein C2S53_005195 [Perilla frutescens var. hirtella]|uniref:Uncharacterized protein n=1 Tax=Perilla frutescens var. hirtella TaxID=608512 RepID=A0AAD4PET3_PERFH|nr:hypothetical protein C2S53_005195 [Perilla frutescens var. hirtella]